jgi:glycosyltransferase involved in cell wall biosynthesis
MNTNQPWGKGNRRVLVHGTPFFGRLFAECMGGEGWSFRYHADSGAKNLAGMLMDLQACDIVYQICGRATMGKFLRAAKLLRKRRLVVHWIGSDVLEAQHAGGSEPWLARQAVHWAETPWVADEVRALGMSCETMALPGARLAIAPTPLAPEFSVLIYIPGTQLCTYYGDAQRVSDFYGLGTMLEVARGLPQIRFDMVGVDAGSIGDKSANIRVHGRVPDMTRFYEQATVLWRPVAHDGLSFMVLEALAHGRHVIWSYGFPGCRQATTAGEARQHILELHGLHEKGELQANVEGVGVIDESYRAERLKTQIIRRLEELMES